MSTFRKNWSEAVRDNDLIVLELFLHHETPKAMLVSEFGVKEQAVWLPLSQIGVEFQDRQIDELEIIKVTIPEWLAREKGLI